MAILHQTIDNILAHYAQENTKLFQADVFYWVGGIAPQYLTQFRSEIENLKQRGSKSDNLVFFIHTGGGVAETVERMVQIMRQHYNEIWFVVPDLAMSAGTILCMSGDKIYMDYSSALGPIDPQVPNNEGQLVPALGYLAEVKKLIDKSANNSLTDAEFAILQNQDLATLHRYEQARKLSIDLLEEWLVKYKFKDWLTHSSTDQPVTDDEKKARATEIAEQLSNHEQWNSHGRAIGINRVRDLLRLKVEDYTGNQIMTNAIRAYSDLMLECCQSRNLNFMLHCCSYVPTQNNQNIS